MFKMNSDRQVILPSAEEGLDSVKMEPCVSPDVLFSPRYDFICVNSEDSHFFSPNREAFSAPLQQKAFFQTFDQPEENGVMLTKRQAYTQALERFHSKGELAIREEGRFALLCYARCLIRAGTFSEVEQSVGYLNELAGSCFDNLSCNDALFEEQYFTHLLLAVAGFKLDRDGEAIQSLRNAQRIADRFRLNSVSLKNPAYVQQQHFLAWARHLGEYLTEDDVLFCSRSEVFAALWESRQMDAKSVQVLRQIKINSLQLSPFFQHCQYHPAESGVILAELPQNKLGQV